MVDRSQELDPASLAKSFDSVTQDSAMELGDWVAGWYASMALGMSSGYLARSPGALVGERAQQVSYSGDLLCGIWPPWSRC
jgi:hypothetical protein